jgi:two-component system NtrC family sensor kinase
MLFSLVPLFFVTGYSLQSYERAVNQELNSRLQSNSREIEVIVSDFESNLKSIAQKHSKDPLLISYLQQNAVKDVQSLIMRWMGAHFASRISVFAADGRLVAAALRGEKGGPRLQRGAINANIFLSESYLQKIGQRNQWYTLDLESGKKLELIAFTRIFDRSGKTAGFLEEIVILDRAFLVNLRKRMNLDFFILGNKNKVTISSHPDLSLYPANFFTNKVTPGDDSNFELVVRGVPHGVSLSRIPWGEESFVIGLAASKKSSIDILSNVRRTFSLVVISVIALLLVATIVVTRNILKPLNDLVSAIQTMDQGEVAVEIAVTSDNEIGLVTETFNEMSRRVTDARADLKQKIMELEAANFEIRETQSKLVHSAKMVSLGQLVAGVAHELNNPIGYISSNMDHLKEYCEKLLKIIDTIGDSSAKTKKIKKDYEYDYIVKDLPKLIKSCQDGAQRTKEIVVGLRNFSRLEESKLKKVDIHEGLETTLNLLSGELKGRIEVHREFNKIPKLKCYASELNQVFMNLLANAAHAIEGEGDIWITTRLTEYNGEKAVEVAIRDNGVGMDDSTVDKIFDPFFTTKAVGQGTGLGLSISYGVIKKHGGEILVTSQLGKGTSFHLILPFSATGL